MTEANQNQPSPTPAPKNIRNRFRGFLPVVVDVETAGFDPEHHALLEIAAVFLDMDEEGKIYPSEEFFSAVWPYEGSSLDTAALKFLKIANPQCPSRDAQDEGEALKVLHSKIKARVKAENCTRAILVAHNAHFDHAFLLKAMERHKLSLPFHQFSTLDTVTLSALTYGQTVLAKSVYAAGIPWDNQQAHNALYDAQKTAELFCHIFNQAPWPLPLSK